MFNKSLADRVLHLLKIRNIKDSIFEFGRLLKSVDLDCKNIFYLHLAQDFKNLSVYDIGQTTQKIDLVFDAVDFSHPFSHVIQSQKERKLTYNQAIVWENNSFKQLLKLSLVDKNDTYCLFPICHEQKHSVVGLLLLQFSRENTSRVLGELFYWIVSLYNTHISNLDHFYNVLNERKNLVDTLESVKNDENNQKLYYQVSSSIVGNSNKMHQLFTHMVKVAPTSLSTLIHGNTGVGKEVVARTIHRISDRGKKAFIAVNCASIPAHLFESEIFGHTKGAFTGADSDRDGLLALADGGTLFLDEIGDMPLEIQGKFLRVLENKKFRPLGSDVEKKSDFRILCATHVDLKSAISQKKFRSDLFYRIAQYTIQVPRLSERLEDIPLLVDYFIDYFNQNNIKKIEGISPEALKKLIAFEYDGNVRELKSIVLACCTLTNGGLLTVEVITQYFNVIDRNSNDSDKAEHKAEGILLKQNSSNKKYLLSLLHESGGLTKTVGILEKELVLLGLTECDFNRKHAADFLQIPLRTLSYKCQVYDLSKD